MRTKGDRDRLVQVLVNSDSTTGQGRAQLRALELPDLVGETHCVIARYYTLVLQREDQVEILAPERHKGAALFAGRFTKALVKVSDILLTEKTIGLLQGVDSSITNWG